MDEREKSDEDRLNEWFRIHPNPDWVPAKPWNSSITETLKAWFRIQPNPEVAPPSDEDKDSSGDEQPE